MKTIALALIFMLSIGSVASAADLTGAEKKALRIALKDGRLAELPKSAANVKAWGWYGLFSGEEYVRFEATAEDIEQFITSSPSIKESKPTVYSTEKQRLPYPENMTDDFFLKNSEKNEYYFYDKQAPQWYVPTIKVKGRKYEIPLKDNHNWGSVIIDDDKNIVYINVIFS